MKCWVCSRQSRGFGHADTRYPIGDRRRYPIDWAFCSGRCQDIFRKLYGHWEKAVDDGLPKEATVIDATPLEKESMRKCLRFFGEAAESIGFDKPLGAYSEAEALAVIEAIVTAYTDEMARQHESSKYPPVRMQGVVPVNDPFSDFHNDLPWEAK